METALVSFISDFLFLVFTFIGLTIMLNSAGYVLHGSSFPMAPGDHLLLAFLLYFSGHSFLGSWQIACGFLSCACESCSVVTDSLRPHGL